MGRRLKHQFANNIYLRAIKSCPINFSFWDHFSEQLSTRRSWPAFETVLLHLKQKCPLSFVQPPPSPPLKIPKQKHCDVFLKTSFAISLFFPSLVTLVTTETCISYRWTYLTAFHFLTCEYSYNSFEKGCRKKCTRKCRKVLWLFSKEIWKNGTRGNGRMFASAKGKQQK